MIHVTYTWQCDVCGKRHAEKEDVVPGNPPEGWRQYADGFVKKFLVCDECEETGKCLKNS